MILENAKSEKYKERNSRARSKDTQLSSRTKKQIDSLPEHAQNIFKKIHTSALEEYQDPSKRRGDISQSAEEMAHKTAWAAIKRKYKKQGDKWAEKG